MALSVVHREASAFSRLAIDWPSVQLAQFEHDEKYHREISRLTIQDRLKHMALHFAKYAGRLMASHDDETFTRTAVDALIIAVSSANILNLPIEKQALLDRGSLSREQFARELTISAGRMATACEKMDHLEDFPFRRALIDEVVCLLGHLVSLFEAERWNATSAMAARLTGVKEKSIFHGRTK